MTPKDLKSLSVDRVKINAWLDRIGETDEACRNEILGFCAKGGEVTHKDGTTETLTAKSYRQFYVSLAEATC